MPNKEKTFPLLTPKAALVEAMEACLLACERCNRPLSLDVKEDIEAIRALLREPCETEGALLLLLEDYCFNKVHVARHWYTFWLVPYTSHVGIFVLKTLRRFCLGMKLMAARASNAKQAGVITDLSQVNAQLHQQFFVLSKQICALEERVDRMREENLALKDRCDAADAASLTHV